MGMTTATRIVLAKIGLDGHDRGIKVVARGLRDEGFHVIYAGLWQSLEAVVKAVADEDAGWLGLSLLSGAHMTLVPRVLELLRQAGLADVGVLVGGIIPEEDARELIQLGVARVFGPGTAQSEIAEFIRGQGMRGSREARRAKSRQDDRRALSRLLTQASQGEGSETIRPYCWRAKTTRRGRFRAQISASDRRHGQRRRRKEHADRQAHRGDSEVRPVGRGAGLRSAELAHRWRFARRSHPHAQPAR